MTIFHKFSTHCTNDKNELIFTLHSLTHCRTNTQLIKCPYIHKTSMNNNVIITSVMNNITRSNNGWHYSWTK